MSCVIWCGGVVVTTMGVHSTFPHKTFSHLLGFDLGGWISQTIPTPGPNLRSVVKGKNRRKASQHYLPRLLSLPTTGFPGEYLRTAGYRSNSNIPDTHGLVGRRRDGLIWMRKSIC